MKPAFLVLGFVVAGVVGAVFAHVVLPPEPASTPGTGQPDRVDARLDQLEAEVTRLSRALEANRLAPVIDSLKDEVKPEILETKPREIVGDPVIKDAKVSDENVIEEKVRKVIAEKQEEARRQREKAAAMKLSQDMQKFLDHWTKELDLTESQREQLADNWKRRVAIGATYKQKFADKGPDITQQERQALQQEMADEARILDDELRKTLSAEQYEKLMGHYKNRGRKR